MAASQKWLEARAAELERNQTYQEKWLGKKMKRWCEKKDLLCHPQITMCGYIVDFFFPQINLAIELDGSHHSLQIGKDEQRDAHLLKNGVRLLRFPNPRNNVELNQILYRVYAEAAYLLKHSMKYEKHRFSTNPQDSQRSKI